MNVSANVSIDAKKDTCLDLVIEFTQKKSSENKATNITAWKIFSKLIHTLQKKKKKKKEKEKLKKTLYSLTKTALFSNIVWKLIM